MQRNRERCHFKQWRIGGGGRPAIEKKTLNKKGPMAIKLEGVASLMKTEL